MRNAGLDEAQARINIARRNISHLRYTNDTVLMAESEEELKSLLMKVPFHTVHGVLKVRILKWFGIPFAHHFMANRWGNSGNSDTFIFWGPKISADGYCSHEIKMLTPWKRSYDQLTHLKRP